MCAINSLGWRLPGSSAMDNVCGVKRFPCKNQLIASVPLVPSSFCAIVQSVPGKGIVFYSNIGPAAGGHRVNDSRNIWGGIMCTLVH